jgi:hypothetical protein
MFVHLTHEASSMEINAFRIDRHSMHMHAIIQKDECVLFLISFVKPMDLTFLSEAITISLQFIELFFREVNVLT